MKHWENVTYRQNQNSETKKKLVKLPFQSTTLLIENYSQNQWNYLKINTNQLIQIRRNRQKQKKLFSSYI